MDYYNDLIETIRNNELADAALRRVIDSQLRVIAEIVKAEASNG